MMTLGRAAITPVGDVWPAKLLAPCVSRMQKHVLAARFVKANSHFLVNSELTSRSIESV